MEPRKIVVLGSTGSIGRSTLEVVTNHPGQFEILALAAHSNTELLAEQYRRFRPRYVCVANPAKGRTLADSLKEEPVEVLTGESDLIRLAGLDTADLVVNAIVGAAGLRASLETVSKGKNLALANKESLVAGGPLFAAIMAKTKARILPIDSEHSALWQVLACGKADEIRRLILTASGGPFRDFPPEKFAEITPEMALRHPTWEMGPKITVDSATLANKGLEVIEAVALFSVPPENISVVIHPQSIIHSIVEFIDSSMVAQLSMPDMRLPITYALFWPKRVASGFGRLDIADVGKLTFEEPDLSRFPVLKTAYKAAQAGGTAPAVFNAANEIAVAAFLKESLAFNKIVDVIEDALYDLKVVSSPAIDDIIEADKKAREKARRKVGKLVCC
ncbi:MAG: 1-deoxy-D-xylulose-5-phosphate reductoisomerase [candidate division Zixibacteria bacterium]|nr:1-deoxy-D-xylulose-5-phosphate reductoisomerase [candidate division Zixibacteria bacterium]